MLVLSNSSSDEDELEDWLVPLGDPREDLAGTLSSSSLLLPLPKLWIKLFLFLGLKPSFPSTALIIIDDARTGTYSPPSAKVTKKFTRFFFSPLTRLKRVLSWSSSSSPLSSLNISFRSFMTIEAMAFPPFALFPLSFFVGLASAASKVGFPFRLPPAPPPPLGPSCLKRHASPNLQYPLPREKLKQIPYSLSSCFAFR